MISDRYFSRDRERSSWRKVCNADEAIPVRTRLMKAVFFLSDESSEPWTGKRSKYVVG